MKIKSLKQKFDLALGSFFNESERNGLWNYVTEFVLKINSIQRFTEPDKEFSIDTISTLDTVIQRLKTNEPIQYVLGNAFFYNSIFRVNTSVLIPRPETEELVVQVLNAIQKPGCKILDIGTGSGCIAVSLKKERADVDVTAVDISHEALEIAKYNANHLLGKNSIQCVSANVLSEDFERVLNDNFDIILSNPPYIPENEKVELAPNVVHFEPHLALFCDDDPLLFYRAIAKHSLKLLNSGGILFLEIHENFGLQVLNLLKEFNFEKSEVIKDMHGKDRIVKAIKNK